MKKQWTMIATFLILGASAVSAQSLGDYARTVRKEKSGPAQATRHFDNDNLPVNDTVSVVGLAPEATSPAGAKVVTDAKGGTEAKAAGAAQSDSKQAAADKTKEAEDFKKKIEEQQEKINSLNREVDLDQREERLRAAAFYQDAGSRLRNPAEWTKEQSQAHNDAADKQKSLDAARQKLEEMQEEARKAGIVQKDTD